MVACDLTDMPRRSPPKMLTAKPYAYLDDAPLEERRSQAVMNRRWLTPSSAADIGRLDLEAIARVRTEAWPDPVNEDEQHDALSWLGATAAEAAGWSGWLETLARQGRVTRLRRPGADIWIAAERLPQFLALWPEARQDPAGACCLRRPAMVAGDSARRNPARQAGRTWVRSAPPPAAAPLDLEADATAAALVALETEGFAMRGRFTHGANVDEWCERGLLARIHRYTVNRLRAEIEPVAARDFLRFLFAWQHVTADARMEGPNALAATVAQLEGFGSAGWGLGDGNPACARRRL